MTPEEDKSAIDTTDALGALESFVVDNDDLLALESLIGRFNIFDALGIARAEIRHSNFLAFILDPAESHGQGQVFLKAVLMDLLKSAPPNLRPFSPIELDGTDLRGIVIKREWEHIDLLISCQEPPFVVAIENKVYSKEHSDQLSRYQDTMKHHYPNHRPLYVYLTPDGDDPSEEAWVRYSYQSLYNVLKRARETYRKAIGDDVLVFLDHYLNLIGTRFMNETAESKQIDEHCQRIYKNHRQALDLIWARAGSPASGVMAEVEKELDPRWSVVFRGANRIDFVPGSWLKWLPPLGTIGEPVSWIRVVLWVRDERLAYNVLIGPMTDPAKRREFVSTLLDQSSSFGFKRSKAKKVTEKWSNITSVEYIVEWGEDEEPEPETIRAAVKKTLDDLYPKLEKLALVLKPLCQLPGSTK